MKKNVFKFFQDKKVTIWNRVEFTINAENKEKAIEKLAAINLGNVDVCSLIDDDVVVDVSDSLWDTQEIVKVSDNNGHPTIEVYDIDDTYTQNPLLHNGIY